MTKSLISFCDLDGTFIQTVRHIAEGVPRQTVYISDTNKEIVITDKQLNLYNTLLVAGYVIPVTARSLESTNRLLSHLRYPTHKICNHGVYIYDQEDQLITKYTDGLIGLVSNKQHSLRKILDQLGRICNGSSIFEDLRFKPTMHHHYILCIEVSTLTEFHAKMIEKAIKLHRHDGIVVSRNGKGISVTCSVQSYKQLACNYLLENCVEYQGLPTLGFGDSLSDLPFMKGCDYSVIPNNESTQIQIG